MEDYQKLCKKILDRLKIAKEPLRTPDLRRAMGKVDISKFYAALTVLEAEDKVVECEPLRPKDAVRWKIAPEPKLMRVKK